MVAIRLGRLSCQRLCVCSSIYRLVEVVADTSGLLTDIGNVLAWLWPSSPTKPGFCCSVFMLILQSVAGEEEFFELRTDI